MDEDKEQLSTETEPKKSGSGIIALAVIVAVVLLAILGYLGYKSLQDSNSPTPAPTATTVSLVSSTVSVDPTSSPARDPELSVLARKYFDWIIAEQRSGEDLIASETYKNLDYLTQNFKDGVKASSDSWQMSALTMSTEPIARYTIDSNYAQPTGDTGQVNLTVYSETKAWNVVLTTIKENGVWKIDNVGAAG